MCSHVDFRVVMALFLVSAGQTLVLAEGPPKTEKKGAVEKAKQKLDDYLLDMESIGNMAFLFCGDVTNILSERKFSGTFPYVGFRAVRYGGKRAERFWQIRSQTLDPAQIAGFAYDELLVGDDRWFSTLGGEVKKYVPEKNREYEYKFMQLDPRVAILCYVGAVELGETIKPQSYRYISSGKVVDASEDPKGITAVINAGGNSHHLFFDKAQGYRPTRLAVVKEGQELEQDAANATTINRLRWKKNKKGKWMPEIGDNTYFFGKTVGDFGKLKRITYKCVWIEPEELPASIFDQRDLDSVPGRLMSMAEDWIQIADQIPSLDSERHGRR